MRKDLQDSELYEAQYRFKERRSNTRFFVILLVFLTLVFGFRLYWTSNFGGVQVDGASMNRTLVDGEQLLVRYADGKKSAKRGDIIVVYVGGYPEVQEHNRRYGDDVNYVIKRLIAIEGDTVKCTDGQIYIKYAGETEFVPLDEPYAYYSQGKESYDFAEYVVGEGRIFFLGDNRNNSVDSRYQENTPSVYYSHLKDDLYKAEDIFGVVPQWALRHKKLLQKIFF